MFSSRLTTLNDVVRSGVAAARSRIAGRSSFTVGSAARVNGRISSRMIGVDSRRNGCVCCSDGPSARAAGRRSSSVGPATFGERRDLAERILRRRERTRAASAGSARSEASWSASVSKTALEYCTKFAELRVATAELVGQQREVVHDAREVLPAQREALVDLAGVLGRRLEPADRLRELAALALGAEPLRAVVEQQQQVVARVGVQRREDLVEVDVGQRLRDRDHVALLQATRLLGAGRDLGHHVLEAGLGPQQHRRVLVERRVLGLDPHADDRLAVAQRDRGDLADLDARDVDRLALARRDGLRGRHLGVDLEEVLADDRHPGRQREPLLAEDHARRPPARRSAGR